MGTFIYSGSEIEFDDRTLAHLQVVIGAKLRRGEAFYFTWQDPVDSASGRNVIWLHASHTLRYKYSAAQMPILNRAWIEKLTDSANSTAGLRNLPEPGEE